MAHPSFKYRDKMHIWQNNWPRFVKKQIEYPGEIDIHSTFMLLLDKLRRSLKNFWTAKPSSWTTAPLLSIFYKVKQNGHGDFSTKKRRLPGWNRCFIHSIWDPCSPPLKAKTMEIMADSFAGCVKRDCQGLVGLRWNVDLFFPKMLTPLKISRRTCSEP